MSTRNCQHATLRVFLAYLCIRGGGKAQSACALQMWPQQEALLPPGLMAKVRSDKEQEISKSEEGLLKEAMQR